ncbi:MAG: hypothetical protein ACTHL1_07375 [Burkholderiaceae bacterium]
MPENDSNERQDPAAEQPAEAKEGLLSGKTTQIAMGAAATMGLLLLYKLSQKMLEKDDPESYQNVQRIKAALKVAEADARKEARRKRVEPVGGRRTRDRRTAERDGDAAGDAGEAAGLGNADDA